MTHPAYKRFSRIRRAYPSVAATFAVVIALVGVPGVTAGGLLVTSKQIKNNSITSADLHKSAVKSSDIDTSAVRSTDIKTEAIQSTDIGTGEVSSSDIGPDEVTPVDVNMPDPSQLKFNGTASIAPSLAYQKVVDLGVYAKADPTSALEVTWTGSVLGENGGETSGCVFQLRVDGAAAPAGGGEVFGKGTVSVSASALFPGLPPGAHQVEVWARMTVSTSAGNNCAVGPPAAGIGQTAVVAEQVL